MDSFRKPYSSSTAEEAWGSLILFDIFAYSTVLV